MKCLNRDTLEYQVLAKVSGVQGFDLDASIRYHLDNFGRYPYLDEIPGADSKNHLSKILDIHETSGIMHMKRDVLVEFTGKETIEEMNAVLNDKFRDLEISLTEVDEDTSIIQIKHRPSENAYVDNGIKITNENVNSRFAIVRSINKLVNLYGIKINEITTDELNSDEWKGKIPEAHGANAFIYNGEIYVNTDVINNKEEPKVHELLHIFLGAMRYQDPTLYFTLIQSMEDTPIINLLNTIYKNRSHSDILEEAFVQEYAKYLTKHDSMMSQLPKEILNDINYNIRRALDSVLMGNYSVKALDTTEIMQSTLSQLSKKVESELCTASFPSFISVAAVHRKVANIKEDLMRKEQLREDCNG